MTLTTFITALLGAFFSALVGAIANGIAKALSEPSQIQGPPSPATLPNYKPTVTTGDIVNKYNKL
jgi:hypothetical protein